MRAFAVQQGDRLHLQATESFAYVKWREKEPPGTSDPEGSAFLRSRTRVLFLRWIGVLLLPVPAQEPIHERSVDPAQLFAGGQQPAQLAQQDACQHVRHHMLPRRQRADAHRDGHQQRRAAPERRDLPVPADADPAEPGDEAVQRGEEVVRLVDPIEEAHARVPEARSVRLRLRHRRREENEKEKAYGFPEEVGAEKAVGSPARKRRDPAVQEEPENEAREEINENRPGKKRDRSVDRKRQTIMALSLRQKAGKLEGDLIAQQRKDEGEPEIPFFLRDLPASGSGIVLKNVSIHSRKPLQHV